MPPAGPGDVERVAGWRATRQGTRLVLLSPHGAVAVRLQALELGFDDAIDLASDPMEIVGTALDRDPRPHGRPEHRARGT